LQTIYQRPKTEKGYRYRPVAEGRGKKTGDLTPPFYVRVWLNGKQSWQRLLAETFAEAKQEAGQVRDVVEAASKGLTVAESENIANANRVTVKSAVDAYLALKGNKAKKTVAQYTMTLNEFLDALAHCRVKFLDEVTENTLRKYKMHLEKEGFAGKTIDTRVGIVSFLLKKNGVTARIPRDEMPAVEKEDAVPYSEDELTKLFAAMDAEQRIRYNFFLGSGCRDQEVTFASWGDIDFAKSTYTVRRKEDVGFSPKSHESRTIPLPESLVASLKARRKAHPDDRWLFLSAQGNPDNHFLRKLKKIALRAKLNCGQCVGTIAGKEVSCKTHPVCEHVYLHRFRKTCATRWQEAVIPVRTIQAWLGHKSLLTTETYLGVTDSKKLRPQINRAFGD